MGEEGSKNPSVEWDVWWLVLIPPLGIPTEGGIRDFMCRWRKTEISNDPFGSEEHRDG